MKRDPSNSNLNLPCPAKALTPPVTSPAVLALCQHSKLVRSRFHQPEAGKWSGVEWSGVGREGRPFDGLLGPGKGPFYFKGFRKRLKRADLQALHVSLRIGSTSQRLHLI